MSTLLTEVYRRFMEIGVQKAPDMASISPILAAYPVSLVYRHHVCA